MCTLHINSDCLSMKLGYTELWVYVSIFTYVHIIIVLEKVKGAIDLLDFMIK